MLNYTQIVQSIESRTMMPTHPPCLDKMREALKRLIPESFIDPETVIIVAGTNGKGSVCALLESLLIETGQSVAVYTSPHLIETTERFRVNGADISKYTFCEAYEKVANLALELDLTHFEILTLMAAWIFFLMPPQPKWKIFEVGLGGLWDATNAIPHLNCVITSLGLDHQNILGNTLEEIARNKFGIIPKKLKGKQPARVVHAPLPENLLPLKKEVESETQSEWIKSVPFSMTVKSPIDQVSAPRFHLSTLWGETEISLPGLRGAQNASVALTLFHQLGFNPALRLSALSKVLWPGRMEKLPGKIGPCPIYLSGDHNPQGVQSLIELLQYYPRKHLMILAGVGVDKNLEEILQPLSAIPQSSLFLTEVPYRGRSLNEYGAYWLAKAQGVEKDPFLAFERILKLAEKDDLILVTGSLYLVGFIKGRLRAIHTA